MNYKIFLIIYLLQLFFVYYDLKNCIYNPLYSESYIIIYILLRHLFDVYVFFGSFVSESKEEYIIHSIVIGFILMNWFKNNYRSQGTEYLNVLCMYPNDKWLSNLIYVSGIHTKIYYIHSYWLVISLIYNIYKIF